MLIKIDGQPTLSQYQRAHWLHTSRSRSFLIAMVCLALLIVLSLNAARYDGLRALAPLTFMPLLAGVYVIAFRGRVRQAWKYVEGLQDPVTGTLGEDGIVLRGNQWRWKQGWGGITRYVMTRDMLLLYEKKGAFRMIPRAYLASEQDWQALRQLIEFKFKTR